MLESTTFTPTWRAVAGEADVSELLQRPPRGLQSVLQRRSSNLLSPVFATAVLLKRAPQQKRLMIV